MKTIRELISRLYDSNRLTEYKHVTIKHAGITFSVKTRVIAGILRLQVIAQPPSEPANVRGFSTIDSLDSLLNHIATLADNLGEPGLKTTKSSVLKNLLNE